VGERVRHGDRRSSEQRAGQDEEQRERHATLIPRVRPAKLTSSK
jgi:hypothetical protein